MAGIQGVEGLSVDEINAELTRGGKFVIFPYCISALVITFRRNSDIYFIRSGESALSKGWPFALISLFLGWWGIPWGVIWTPIALFQTLGGGKDVTAEVVASAQPAPMPPPVVGGGPQNPWSAGR